MNNKIANRITLSSLLLLIVTMLVAWALTGRNSNAQEVTVYKDPNCRCCAKWIDHLRDNGFTVKANNLSNSSLSRIKAEHGITFDLASCHTALVEGYAVEGHVPADVIKRLLSERPEVKGIAVPGMPMGSPGMEGGYSENYDILTFDAEGKTAVYTSR